jgi:hypothetical protein
MIAPVGSPEVEAAHQAASVSYRDVTKRPAALATQYLKEDGYIQ